MDERGRCVVIGAAGGIGHCLIDRLRSSGWNLTLAGRTEASLREVAGEGERVVALDAADFDAVDALLRDEDDVRGVVNLAGSILIKPAHSTAADEFEHTVSQNLRTAFAVTRAAAKVMRKNGGSVVLMSSCAASTGLASHEAIASAKAGVEGLTRSAAATYAGAGVRFNAVAPGLVDTPMASRLTGSEASLKASIAMHPLGRIGEPDEIARVIEFLVSPESSWITGQVLGVDGGLARVRGRG
ncbi:MAG: SDR family oxidoreductase [Planctomycetota bacterium]